MTKEEIDRLPWYLCNLVSPPYDCPRKNTCKRYQFIKDNPYDDYKDRAAKLYNICNKMNFHLYMKVDDIQKEEKKE